MPDSVTDAPNRTSWSSPASAVAVVAPSTLRVASPVVGSPARVMLTSVVPFLIVAPLEKATRLSLVADSVCTHTPSGSASPGLMAYSKVSVSVPEPET